MKKKLHFWVILLLAFLLLLPLTVPALGETKSSLNPDLRWLALYSGVYIVSHSYDGPPPFGEVESPDWWKGQETKAQALSEQEFNLFLRENLLSAISRFDKGERICWNKDFVQTMVKEDFPDLYQKIESQINTQDKREYNYLLTGIAQLNYTPGSRTRTFDAIMYNVFGMPVWGFFCRIYWVWNSTSITSIPPSSWGE